MINKKLEEKILSNIPNDYSNLEKALLIYKRLCENLQYSLECYLDEKNVLPYFTDVKNLQNVDGETNKDVVCFTFNAILVELFNRAKVVGDIDHEGYIQDEDKIVPKHFPVEVTIDGIDFIIEATNGIIDNNDLVLSKYSTHMPSGWSVYPEDNDDQKAMLQKSIDKVYSENKILENNIEKYLNSKDDLKDIPLKLRLNMFFKFSKSAEYSLLGFNKLLKLKHLFFTGEELLGEEPNSPYITNQKIDFHFIKQNDTGEFKALVFYNPDGFSNYKPKENADSLQTYEISLSSHHIIPISRSEIQRRYEEEYYVDRKGFFTTLPKIANDELTI